MRTCNTIQTGKRPFPSRTLRALGTTAAAAVLTLCAALIAAVISVTLSSCEHKEFCAPEPPSARVRVLFDWKNAPGASATGMSLYLYPEEGGDALRYDFPNASGGTVEIPFGRYRALFLNNDSEVNLMRGTEDFSSFEVYTRNSWPLEPLGLLGSAGVGPADEPVVLASGPLWGGQEFPVEIPPAGVRAVNGGAEPDMQLTLFPARRTCVYTVEIVNVRNLKYASAMSFSLSGLSGSVSPGTGRRSAMRSTVPFPARIDESSSRVAARFLCFGTSTSGNNAHTLSLYVISSDGSRQYYTFDVGAQVNGAADPGSVHILIDGLTLPRPIVNGGGFHPSVEEWENVTEEIDM